MTPRRSRNGIPSSALLIAANILIPAAILIFATGFFPYKPLLPGLANYESVTGYGDPPPAPFDKLIFMVIDALRSDFVYTAASGFEYTQSLVRDGAALPFTAHATSPTVTMPRLKAITTGSIPSFLDVVLNLDEGDESSSLASQDTWLAQMRAKQTGKLIMYGDDTWLKLFPGTFDRADGTTSFFVSDFTEVDNNVTRHISEELKSNDWNTMVLHYLGLDHIGHKGGPRSPHMIVKQREMDNIVQQIYSAIETEEHLRSTLFVVCGDHGMNDAGNHGASSAGETSAALVFMSPKLRDLRKNLSSPVPEDESFQYYSTVEQSDLAPTLAALLGFPVPKNNLGALIPDFLPFWSNEKDQVQLLMRNARQILDIVVATFGQQILEPNSNVEAVKDSNADYLELARGWQALADRYSKTVDDGNYSQLIPSITQWLHKAQGLISGMASNYDMSRLFLGQATAVAAVVAAFTAVYYSINDKAVAFVPLGGIILLYGIMMFASSYVEEEHHFWYWAATAWFSYLGLSVFKRGNTSATLSIVMLLAIRIVRSWNQTGQKFAGEPDMVKIYLHPNPVLLWCLAGATYFWVHQNLIFGLSALPIWFRFTVATGLVLAAFTFKVAFTLEDAPELVTDFARQLLLLTFTQTADLVSRARAVFIGVGLGMGGVVAFMLARQRISWVQSGTSTILTLLTLLLITQSRATNIPLFLLLNLQFRILLSQIESLTPLEVAISTLLLQHASFFAFGGSNAVSSVDLSSAYNGIGTYDPFPVGILTFTGNWAGSIWWAVAGVILLQSQRGHGREPGLWKGHVAVLTLFVAGSVAAVMAACTALRTHLFIWTVFSPKYLYCVAWSLGQHLLVNVGIGGLVYGLGVWERQRK